MKFVHAIKDRLPLLKDKALIALRYTRDFRKNWPRTREWLLFAWGRVRVAAIYLRDIRRHWPEIRASLEHYRNEIYRPMYNKYFAAVGYLPFIGWLAPLYLKPDDALCRENGRRGFALSVLFTGIALALFFLYFVFVPRDWRAVRFVLALSVYLVHASYFIICIWAVNSLVREKTLEMPWLEKYTHMVEL
ncbi:MAG: hypothetical protein EHM32_13015 [Spirochaetales bacterium]|nr:MAG: hypothetical protein EHM32_13015 [Spirochaetales bacterium]